VPEKVSAQPPQYRTITPHLICNEAARAIEFYKKVFGAVQTARMDGPGGKVLHAELRIGDSMIFVADWVGPGALANIERGQMSPISLHIYVEDVDAVFQAAVEGGAHVDAPVQDQFWGDRFGRLTDPFGQHWGIGTHKEDVAPEEMKRRMQEMMSKMKAHA